MRHTLLLFASLSLACESVVQSGLTERDADEIVVALQQAGVGADKEGEPGGEAFRVTAPEGELAAALTALRASGLPRRHVAGFQALEESAGLLPSRTEEDVRVLAATAGELAQSLETVDGVVSARVHLSAGASSALDAAPAPARASVLLKHRSGPPPITVEDVRALVIGAAPNLSAENVHVIYVPVAAGTTAPLGLVRVGPVAVSAGSATVARTVLFTLLTLNLVLAGLVVVFWRKRAQQAR